MELPEGDLDEYYNKMLYELKDGGVAICDDEVGGFRKVIEVSEESLSEVVEEVESVINQFESDYQGASNIRASTEKDCVVSDTVIVIRRVGEMKYKCEMYEGVDEEGVPVDPYGSVSFSS